MVAPGYVRYRRMVALRPVHNESGGYNESIHRRGSEWRAFHLVAFVLMVAAAFKTSLADAQDSLSSAGEQRVAWGLWSSLLSHVVAFLSVTYFDQMQLFWFLVLACISDLRLRARRVPLLNFVLMTSPESLTEV